MRLLPLLVPSLLGAVLQAQAPGSPLDALVATAMRDNLALRGQALGTTRAGAAVREARGLYLPSATLNARYTELSGNTINIGQLINPAFGALNDLLQRPAFPTDVDVQLPLRQETTVRLAQPLFQPAIRAANRMATAMADMQTARQHGVARGLAADVRSGYLTFVKMHHVVGIFDSTIALLDEHVRVAERLVQAGSATPDVVLRARAERSDVLQKRDEAVQLRAATQHALNMLLNRPLDTDLIVWSEDVLAIAPLPTREEAVRSARSGREELRTLDHAYAATEAKSTLARGSFLPAMSLALDYGIQGRDYRFDSRRDFAALTIVASWNVFNGGQDLARVQQAHLESRQVTMQRDEVASQVELQAVVSWEAAQVTALAINTANDRLASARRSFELVRKRHEVGAATQLEYLDARVTFTTAQLNAAITRFDHLIKRVELDRVTARYALPPVSSSR